MKYKSNQNIVYSCKYHVVWCPKYRRSILVNEVDNRLKEILLKVVQETKSEMIEMETMPDHVHILVEVDPQFGIHRLVKRMKATSANILRKEFPYLRTKLPTLWSNYFVSTVGGAPLAIIKQYIQNQKRSEPR